MATWEEQWAKNSTVKSEPWSRARDRAQKPTLPRRPSTFGADPTVHYTAPVAVAPVVTQAGGSFTNAVLLLLGGFAVGTLWGEGMISKALGAKHPSK